MRTVAVYAKHLNIDKSTFILLKLSTRYLKLVLSLSKLDKTILSESFDNRICLTYFTWYIGTNHL